MDRLLSVGLVVGVALAAAATELPGGEGSDDARGTKTSSASGPRRPDGRLPRPGDPYDLVSQASLIESLEELTAFGRFSGWRHSTTSGEAAAINWVQARLTEMPYLEFLGLEIEQQPFRTYLGVEFHATRLWLTVNGEEHEVPADGIPGHRESLPLAMRFDSDGVLNDMESDPRTVQGPAVLVRSASAIQSLAAEDVAGRVVFVDYAAIDRSIIGSSAAVFNASELVALGPTAVVAVTTFSNTRGISHGSFAGDLPAFVWVVEDENPPILNLRIEDLEGLGISGWGDMARIESARLRLDVDLFSPGASSNLVARIPGADSSRAVILGAHIDSPNSPGALDNGSGSVTLLEVARVIDAARVRPPVDLYLTWFGSHERGLYGSSNFVAANQDLLDRTIAMLQTDCLTRPLDGIDAYLNLEMWPYGRFGDARLTWPDYLGGVAAEHGVSTVSEGYYYLVSDNTSFAGYDVPNANHIYMNPYEMDEVHYDGHLHDPYETVDLVRDVADILEDMARVAVGAALRTGRDDPVLRVTPRSDRRVVFVASHTEGPHMLPTCLTDLGMALAWEGFDVDVVPYGQAVTTSDLEDADLVVVLPIHDYPSPDGDLDLYEESWTSPEVDALEAWVDGGGLMVLTNTGHRLKYYNSVLEANEDWDQMNVLAGRFGIEFTDGGIVGTTAAVFGSHTLVQGVRHLRLAQGNGVRYSVAGGQVLARAASAGVVTLVTSGAGEVVVMADLGILGNDGSEPVNLAFWRNLAQYARQR